MVYSLFVYRFFKNMNVISMVSFSAERISNTFREGERGEGGGDQKNSNCCKGVLKGGVSGANRCYMLAHCAPAICVILNDRSIKIQ